MARNTDSKRWTGDVTFREPMPTEALGDEHGQTGRGPGSIQRHPLLWGWLWAGLTFALVTLVSWARGDEPKNWLIALLIWAVAGAAWGYGMKWFFDRRAKK